MESHAAACSVPAARGAQVTVHSKAVPARRARRPDAWMIRLACVDVEAFRQRVQHLDERVVLVSRHRLRERAEVLHREADGNSES